MSTRVLYGNYKNRGRFPDLLAERNAGTLAALRPASCSVCGAQLPQPAMRDVWITLPVGTDRVPLLATTCSPSCVQKLPTPPKGYVAEAHTGGSSVVQPPTSFHDPFTRT